MLYHLVMDHVEPQDTDGALALLPATAAIPHVVTGRDSREGFAHGVGHVKVALLGRHLVVLDDVWPVAEEVVLEELVGDEPDGDDDQEVELLAAEEVEGVHVVLVVQVFLECRRGFKRLLKY